MFIGGGWCISHQPPFVVYCSVHRFSEGREFAIPLPLDGRAEAKPSRTTRDGFIRDKRRPYAEHASRLVVGPRAAAVGTEEEISAHAPLIRSHDRFTTTTKKH